MTKKDDKPREVYAGHGHDASMGYKYRIRIEHRIRSPMFGSGEPKSQYRLVLECYFMAWEDDDKYCWVTCTQAEATKRANEWLDEIEELPKGTYV